MVTVRLCGIATIDRQPGSNQIAVWVTNNSGRVHHSNAVVIDAVNDPDTVEKVRSLTRCCVVLTTDGSTLEGLPITGALTVGDIDRMLDDVDEWQDRIRSALAAHRKKTRSRTLVDPEFSPRPVLADLEAANNTPPGRAFALASYAAAAWSNWLQTDLERRRRTVQPRTGKSPWIMPEDMSDQTSPVFPERFAAGLAEQPMV
ncbi:hypothetical protein [Nocardioides sp.]|uniref:hypothetical protein n=1 Tax=Nocardioides sp. TaxID=35761 RepID=UPI0019C7AB93|nr:hypothetical protein [Nocardioides sp.]MBC7275682.1 hypothetical protein [Nocardioides sp.]